MPEFFIKKIDTTIFTELATYPWVLFYKNDDKVYPWTGCNSYSQCKGEFKYYSRALRTGEETEYSLNPENRIQIGWSNFYKNVATKLGLYMTGKYIRK